MNRLQEEATLNTEVSPTKLAQLLADAGLLGFAQAVIDGEGYVIVTVDPVGVIVTPVRGPTVGTTLAHRSRLRKMRHELNLADRRNPGAVAVPADSDEEAPTSDDPSASGRPQALLP